jgi:hypothetical protein
MIKLIFTLSPSKMSSRSRNPLTTMNINRIASSIGISTSIARYTCTRCMLGSVHSDIPSNDAETVDDTSQMAPANQMTMIMGNFEDNGSRGKVGRM